MDGFVWSPQHLGALNRVITCEEIKKAMFSIDDSKAPMVFLHAFLRQRGVLLGEM